MTLETLLTFMASFGGAAFVIKMVLMLTGGDTGEDLDIHDHSDDSQDPTSKSFIFFSTQTIFAFFMLGGILGLAALNAELSDFKIFLSTVFGGLLGGGLSSLVMRSLTRLNSVPVKREPIVGDKGVAYIPMEDLRVGQVLVTLDGREELYEAISKTGLIRAFEDVKVVGKQNNRLVVESLNK